MPIIHRISEELVSQIVQDYRSLSALNLADNGTSQFSLDVLLEACHLPLAEIEVIENLEPLNKLVCLNLSNNKITRLQGLDSLTSLKQLYVSGNRISSLRGLDALAALEVLHIGDNIISSVTELDHLSFLSNLKELVLEGNPLHSIHEYRAEVIRRLPKCERLDYETITAAERRFLTLKNADARQDKKDKESIPVTVPQKEPVYSSGMQTETPLPTLPVAPPQIPSSLQDDLMTQLEETSKQQRAMIRRLQETNNELGAQLQEKETEQREFASQLKALKEMYESSRDRLIRSEEERAKDRERADESRHKVEREWRGRLEDAREEWRVAAAEKSKQTLLQVNQLTKEKEEAERALAKTNAYYAEAFSMDETASLQEELKQTQRQLQQASAQAQSMSQSNALLKVQVTSLQRMLTLQEESLSEQAAMKDEGLSEEARLLSKWREQVFALMVQVEEVEEARKEEQQRYTSEMKETKRNLVAANLRANLLEERTHSLKAEVSLAKTESALANATLQKVQKTMVNRVSSSVIEQEKLQSLWDMIRQGLLDLGESMQLLDAQSDSLRGYASRLEHAQKMLSKRAQQMTASAQGAEKWQREREQLQAALEAATSAPGSPQVAALNEAEQKEKERLKEQLADVTEQWENARAEVRTLREQLQGALEQSADLGVEKEELLVKMKSEGKKAAQLRGEITEMQEQIQQLEQMRRKSNEENVRLRTEAENSARAWRGEMSKQQAEAALKAQEATERAESKVRMLQAEAESLRREQVKTAAALNTLEKQRLSERERLRLEMQSKVSYLEEKLVKKEKEATSLRRERNGLMATVRDVELGKVHGTATSNDGDSYQPKSLLQHKSEPASIAALSQWSKSLLSEDEESDG
jgi:hypothetical protein